MSQSSSIFGSKSAQPAFVKSSSEPGKGEPHVLTSWKEVAAYLGKGVRTVQRWERELGLPVRRPYGSEKHVIVALPEELDRWMRTKMQTRDQGGGVAEQSRPAVDQVRTVAAQPMNHATRTEQLERLHRLMRVMAERTAEVQRASSELMARATELTRDSDKRASSRKKDLESGSNGRG